MLGETGLDPQEETRRRRRQPATCRVAYRGIVYTLDLARCRRALVRRQVEGEVGSIAGLAERSGVSRSTASRFLAGRGVSLGVTLRILAVLRLRFDEVAVPLEDAG